MSETPSNPSAGASTGNNPPGMAEELRALRRSQSNRVIAGVLGGLGRRLGIDPLVLRIVTAVLALFGGVGIMLYALAWLLVPAEDESASVFDQAIGRREVRDAAAVPLALALGAVFIISSGFIIGSEWNGWILLVLAGVGLVMLLRRNSDDGGSAYQAEPHPYQPSSSDGYVPWSAATEEPSTGAPAASPTHEQPTAAAPDATVGGDAPTAEPGKYGPAVAGTGWPEGPDWTVPEPEPSPYESLYLRREAEPAPEPRRARSVLGLLTFCTALVALGLVALSEALWGVQPGALYVAVPLAVVGVGLVLGTWFGRSRGLIFLGILLTVALAPAAMVSNWDMTSGARTVPIPASVEDVPAEPLTHGAGPFHYDLSQLELTDADEVDVTMQLGLGELRVIVPPDADVTVDGSVGIGSMELFGQAWDGFGPGQELTDLGPDGPGGGQINLDLQLGLGSMQVVRADSGSDR